VNSAEKEILILSPACEYKNTPNTEFSGTDSITHEVTEKVIIQYKPLSLSL
jgi:ABC-type cobalt transport system substrate-binding protein